MHKHFLLQALAQAKIRRGFCAPNPSVGAVVVKDQQILAEGYHVAAGEPHAEVMALHQLPAEQAKDATIYVTLEPCCHHGKTPPCTDLLIAKKIKQVFYGFADPNPSVSLKSAKQLQAANIESTWIDLPEITEFYQSYAYWQRTKKPFVTAKLALSLDGKIALANKQPVAISGVKAQLFTHEQRRMSDAILTTAITINQDDPQLNVRLENATIAKPVYIIDRALQIKPQAKIFTTAKNITIFHAAEFANKQIEFAAYKNIIFKAIPLNKQHLDFTAILQQIGADGQHDLWLEAGGTLIENLIVQQQLQRLLLYVAPITLGATAISAFNTNFNLAQHAKTLRWSSLGEDALCDLRFE